MKSIDTRIARARKAQVLDAAADCFRRSGFHSSSISQISAEASMSSGHIYHYFGNKEDIVAAVVARECEKLELEIDGLKTAARNVGPIEAMVQYAALTVGRYAESAHATLAVEILAEASRNEGVAALVRKSDQAAREGFYELLSGHVSKVESRCEILAALAEGLSARATRNKNSSELIDLEMFQRVTRFVLTDLE